jgi:hypothetical protein
MRKPQGLDLHRSHFHSQTLGNLFFSNPKVTGGGRKVQPHQFTKRKMLLRWKIIARKERSFGLKIRFNIQYDAFIAYRELVRKRHHERRAAKKVVQNRLERARKRVLREWTDRLVNRLHFRAHFGELRLKQRLFWLNLLFNRWASYSARETQIRHMYRFMRRNYETKCRQRVIQFLFERSRECCFERARQNMAALHRYKTVLQATLNSWRLAL